VSGAAEAGFELNRWFIAQRRMNALGVVNVVEEAADFAAGVASVR
jgi:hypothetical protein